MIANLVLEHMQAKKNTPAPKMLGKESSLLLLLFTTLYWCLPSLKAVQRTVSVAQRNQMQTCKQKEENVATTDGQIPHFNPGPRPKHESLPRILECRGFAC